MSMSVDALLRWLKELESDIIRRLVSRWWSAGVDLEVMQLHSVLKGC